MSQERGAAVLKISLRNGEIIVRHGDDGTVLADKTETSPGDWDRLIEALKSIGIKWRYI